MKRIGSLIFLSVILLLTACGTTYHFPTSNTTPAADISLEINQNDQKNYCIELTAKNLAAPSRLSPPRENYSVWIITETGLTKNLGQLSIENAEKVTFKTTTPFKVKEIFITAENTHNNSVPAGTEITRLVIE
jgi:hypothetical protein